MGHYYRERHEAGTVEGNANVAATSPAAPAPDSTTLKELQDQAETLGLPTYGTKADLAQRIADHQDT